MVKNILHKVEDDIFSGSTNLSLILLKEIFGRQILPRTKEVAIDLEEQIKEKVVKEIKNLVQKTENQNDFTLGVERVLELLKND